MVVCAIYVFVCGHVRLCNIYIYIYIHICLSVDMLMCVCVCVCVCDMCFSVDTFVSE